MKKLSSQFLLLVLLANLSPLTGRAAPIPEDCKIGGFAVGCQAWTFKNFSAYEAVEKTALAGAKVIEFFPGQKLSPTQPNAKWDHHADADTITAMQAHLARHGVRAVNYGVVAGRDEAEWRKIFEFAKQLGLYAVTTEDVTHIDILEQLAKEFDIRVAIHNHPARPNDSNYKLWDPNYVLSVVKDRDPRIGACADIGHWATSNIQPLDGVKLLKGRVISAHFKERTAVGHKTDDVPFGTGVSNLKAVLDELQAQGFDGNISIEYETKWDNSLPDVAQCVGYFRGYSTCK